MTRTHLLARASEAEALGRSLLDLAAQLKQDAAEPERAAGGLPTPRGQYRPAPSNSQPALSAAVTSLLALRQRRLANLGLTLAGEAAWDILLALFDAHLVKRDLSVPLLCAMDGAYPATTRRWIGVLVSLGLVALDGPANAQRARLTGKGEIAMSECLYGLVPID